MASHIASMAHFRPEVALLLWCARTCVGSERAQRLRALLHADLDWAYLIRTALRHGVMPLLYQGLHGACPEAVPQAILEQLRQQFYANSLHTLHLTRTLLTLLSLFETQGLRAIPFKGPVLAAAAYGNLTLRQFGDLDILVHKRDLRRAKELLLAQGYQLQLSHTEAFLLQYRYHYAFVRGRVVVEIHWAFTRKEWPFPLEYARLWERLAPVSMAGTTVYSFHPEDTLLILCVHGAKHFWSRLGWIGDIAELIRVSPGIDWQRVLHYAHTLGSERMLLLGLYLAQDLLGAALPEDVSQRMQSSVVVPSLAAQVYKGLFADTADPFVGFQRVGLYLKMRERWQDRVPYVLHHARSHFGQLIAPNAKDRARLSLPAWLCFLYYVLRPIRLVREYGPHLLGSRARKGHPDKVRT